MKFSGLVLAFGFMSPWMLWGLLLAFAPIVIHLLFRHRYHEHRWAAMQFLVAATKSQSKWSRIDQWLLLLVRTLIPLLAALAIAGPFLDRATGGSTATPVHRVLVLDASLSLQARSDGRSRWSQIRDAAIQLVESGLPGDTWQVYAIGRANNSAIIAEPTFLAEAVLDELRQLEVTSEAGHVVQSLAQVLQGIKQAPAGLREIHILTDGQRSQWRPDSAEERESLQQVTSQLLEQAQIIWRDISHSSLGNWAVSDLSVAEPLVMTGHAMRAVATLRQFGETAPPSILEWRIDGRLVASQPLTATTDAIVHQQLHYITTNPGDLRIEASIRHDALEIDDRRGAVCVVRDSVQVLLVDGRPSGVAFENATDCLRLALAPEPAGGSAGGIRPTVITDGQLISTQLDQFDVVVLCDVRALSKREGEILADYVSAGGGLIIGLGPGVNPETYQSSLASAGRPLLPGRIGEIVGDPRLRKESYAFSGADLSHPILSPFRGNSNTGFELTQTFAYRKLRPLPDSRVAVAFENGDPAVLDRAYGRGKVLLLATSLDRTWGTWAVWGHTFVPMMHEAIRYLISAPLQSRQILVGQELRASLPRGLSSSEFELRQSEPEATGNSLELLTEENQLVVPQVPRTGFFGIQLKTPGAVPFWYAVNPESRESDLTPMLVSDLREGSLAGLVMEPLEQSDKTPASASSGRSAANHRLSRMLLGMVILLVIGEPFMAWNRRLGLVIAAGIGATVLVGLWLGPIAAVVVSSLWIGFATWLVGSTFAVEH